MSEQKYRQQGYKDSGPRESRGGGGGFDDRPQRLEGAPRGRGADRPSVEVFRCKKCGEKAQPDFTSDATCRKCGDALHACAQCRHFDSGARFQCRKEIPALIASKTKQNDCALFEPSVSLDLTVRSASGSSSGGNASGKGSASPGRSAFDQLFNKG